MAGAPSQASGTSVNHTGKLPLHREPTLCLSGARGRDGSLVASRVQGECWGLCCGLQAWGSCWVESGGVQGGLVLRQARFWVSCPDCPGPVKPVCVLLCVGGERREGIGVVGTMDLSGILVLIEGVRPWGPRILTVKDGH